MKTFDALGSPTGERGRLVVALRLVVVILLAVAATGCGSPKTVSGSADRTAGVASASEPDAEASPSAEQAEPDTGQPPRELQPAVVAPATVAPADPADSEQVFGVETELPRAAIGFDEIFDEQPSGPQPTSITIDDLDVTEATVIPVGVNEDLSLEVPPADQVGWYQFGPAPGEAGSAVLAAHVAYNGVDGVFRYLEELEVGAVVTVAFDDGSSQRYRVEDVTEYVKEGLPASLWKRTGKEQLALITCGGSFNDQLDSYDSNTVAIAVPI